MKWNYNTKPNTGREVLVAYRRPDGIVPNWDEHVHYTIANYEPGFGWTVPDNWEFLAWSDFDRLKVDQEGNATEHHRFDIAGLNL